MNLTTKYLAKVVLERIILTLVGFTLLFTFFNLIAELDQIGKGTFLISTILAVVLLKIPNVTYEIIPIATLIGSLWAFSELASTSEFTAFRVGGLSPKKAMNIVLIIGLPLTFITVILSEFLIPISEQFSRNWGEIKFKTQSTSNFKSGFWLRDRFLLFENTANTKVKERILNIKKINPDKSLNYIKIYDFDQNSKLISITSSVNGNYQSLEIKNTKILNAWNLVEPTTLIIDEKGLVKLEKYSNLIIPTKLSSKTIEALTVKPEKMSAIELSSFIDYLNSGKQKTNRYEIAYWKKVFYPFLLWIMIIIALPAAYLHSRKGSIGFKIFLGMIVGITFHLGNSLFSHLGLLNTWPPITVAFIPSFLALIFGVFIFSWVQKNSI
ncbi:MAG: LPS export ABC transporter permease LptG [Betaproteobacteria bacterium TMED41]|nr:MAG: LPS export ABC transporter permease LptG [Betaproteobacteria bacterium TMED41]